MTTLTQFAAMYREREQLPLRTRMLFAFGAVAAAGGAVNTIFTNVAAALGGAA